MSEIISKMENGYYEILIRCNDYENFKSFERLLINELSKTGKKVPKYEKEIKSDIPDFTTLNVEKANDFKIIWAFILTISFLCSCNNNSYYKGTHDAYKNIFMSNKQEENMQKTREALAKLSAKLKKLTENLKNREIK